MKNSQAQRIETAQADLLVDRMKHATQQHHTLAEKTGIIKQILNEDVDLDSYTLHLRNLHTIYSALETDLQARDDASKFLSPFFNQMLHRTHALEKDLDNITGFRIWKNLPILKSSQSYADHISKTRAENPIALIGHIYVRYLGDMNGGQVLERLLKNTLHLNNDPYAFYRYPAIVDISTFQSDYRAMFNLKGLNAAQEALIIETAIKAFEFNIALSQEVISVVK